jgi:hypothetical protein
LAPRLDFSGVPSMSSIFWSIARWSLASYPTSSSMMRSSMFVTAVSTPLPR